MNNKPHKQETKDKIRSRAWLKRNHADVWFSRFIRQRDHGQCYTCSNKNDPKKMQCGHFVPRQYISTRYSEINNHCQCYACNMLYNGQPDVYAIHLKKDYGSDIVENLNSMRSRIEIGTDYQKIGDEYKAKYETLIKQESML